MRVAIATGCKGYYKPGTRAWVNWGSRKIRIPVDMYPCRVEERLTIKLVKGEEVLKIETTVTAKDGTITKFPGKFPRYKPTKGLEEILKLILVWEKVNYDISDSDSDLECTARSRPMENEIEDTGDRQVTNNVNNGNNNNNNWNNNKNNGNNNNNHGNGGNNGCSYKGFQACGPREYDGKGGAIALTYWIEKMENVLDNSGCSENQKVKYAASSFVNKALTWWNTQIQARGREAAICMTWNDFKALLVEEFCLSNEMERLENEFWNHKMVGANHVTYTDRFHELAKLVPHLVTPESSRIKSWDQGLLRVWKPDHLQYNCPKLNRAPGQARNPLALEGNHNNQNNGNRATGRAFNVNVNAVEALQDPKVVTGTFSLNDHFATVLFDSGADFSFISTEFAPLLNVKPSIVNLGYVIEVADGKKVEVDRIIRDCKLELGNSLFSINLIPLGHGSFDVIVGMDWLSQNKAVIVCHEKVVEIPLEGSGILRVQGERTLGATKALMNAKVDEPKLSDIYVVRDYVDVFPEDLSGLPLQRQVEFHIDLVLGVMPVAKSPYHLAP
ncbi:putative reverse transcriptase domain-containing protein [Tanacetum coccineum]